MRSIKRFSNLNFEKKSCATPKRQNIILLEMCVGRVMIVRVWYVCLKTENYCLKIFVKVRMGEKVY